MSLDVEVSGKYRVGIVVIKLFCKSVKITEGMMQPCVMKNLRDK